MQAVRREPEEASHDRVGVLDIGTGTGVFALLAARFGARKVYAIEPNASCISAGTLRRRMGSTSASSSSKVSPRRSSCPRKWTSSSSTFTGCCPAHERSLFSVIDARDRFLAASGGPIPCRDTLWAALADVPKRYRDVAGVWSEDVFGIDMTAIRPSAVNMWQRVQLSPSELVTSPACWAVIDYPVLQSPDLRGEVSWVIDAPRTAHGVCVWFDWDMDRRPAPFRTRRRPESGTSSDRLLPWPQPVDLCRGDEVRVQIPARTRSASTDIDRWETSVRRDGGVLTTFQQSDFLGVPRLRTGSEIYRARASRPGTATDGPAGGGCRTSPSRSGWTAARMVRRRRRRRHCVHIAAPGLAVTGMDAALRGHTRSVAG